MDIESRKGNPQERIKVLKFCLKSKMFGIDLVKKNVKNTAAPEVRCKLMGGEAASPTNPEKG